VKVLKYAEYLIGVFASLVVVALAVRFSLLAGPLWRDEVSTLNLATQPTYADVIGLLQFDSAPLLYPTLLRIWSSLGWADQDAGVRLLGFVVTMGLLVTLWLNASALAVRAPLLPLVLFAVQGASIQTMATAKPYGVGTLLGAAAFAAASVAVLRPSSLRLSTATILTILTAQASYTSAGITLAVLGMIVGILMLEDRRRALGIAAVAGLSVIFLLPYVIPLRSSLDWRPLNHSALRLGDVLEIFVQDLSAGSAWYAGVWATAVALAVVAATREVAGRGRKGSAERPALYGLLAGAAATVGLVTIVMLTKRFPQPWHLVHVAAVVAMGLDLALTTTAWLRAARIALALLALVIVTPVAIEHTGMRQTNVDTAGSYVAAAADSGDLIVLNPWFLGLTFARYYDGTVPWTTIPPIADFTVHRYDLVKRQMALPEPLDSLHDQIRATLRAGRRVFFVGGLHHVPEEQEPPKLPPAPGASTGWAEAPYAGAWSLQTGHVVQNEALFWHLIPMPSDQPVQWVEKVLVLVVEGSPRGQPRALTPK
jgi:hypothetical protein